MATYESLTAEQKQDLAIADKFYRGTLSSLARLYKSVDADALNQWIVDNVDDVVASLDPGETIPNATDLAGAKPLTRDEWIAIQAIARSLRQARLDNTALLVKAVGVNS